MAFEFERRLPFSVRCDAPGDANAKRQANSHSACLRVPDDLVQLQLKPHLQGGC